jgi:hypothetical protein
MFKPINSQYNFLRNCLIFYLVVGFFACLIADSYKNFQMSSQSDNASQFSRMISLTVAHQAKETLYK